MRAIVIGAGIGGVTAALAFQRKGIEVIVYERAAEESHTRVGSGMQLAPNGLKALESLQPELVSEITGSAAIIEHMEFLTWQGRLLTDWPVGDWGRKAAGSCTVGIRRGHIQQLISSHLEEGTVRFGHAFAGFEQDDREVRVSFGDGLDERADVLVGADGVQSAVRRDLLRDGPPDPIGYVSFTGFASPDDELSEAGRLRQFIGNGLRIVVFHVDSKTVCWAAFVATRAGQNGAESAKTEARRAFDGWPSPFRALIERTAEEAVGRSEGLARKPVKRWGQGRVTLLGDAAHPMASFGQGANQAIEDAIVLVRCLEEQRDAAAALRAYETKRIGRTASLTRTARLSIQMLQWKNPLAALLRNRVVLPVFSKTVIPKAQRSIYAYKASDA